MGVKDSPDSGVKIHNNPEEAYGEIRGLVSENDRILVFGSFYTVAGVMAFRKFQAH